MLAIYRCKLRELRESLHTHKNTLDAQYKRRAKWGECIMRMLQDVYIVEMKFRIKKIESQIKKFEAYKMMASGKWDKNKQELRIEDAKEYLIGDIVPTEKTGSSGGRDYYLCCLHEEDTSSFVVYKKNNSWYCFGCCAGGDSIALVMQLNNMEFVNAVKHLTG